MDIRERLIEVLNRETSVLNPEDAERLADVLCAGLPELRKGMPDCHPSYQERGGERIAELLDLKTVLARYDTSWGSKTTIGLFLVMARIVDEQREKSVRYVHEQAPGSEALDR